MRKINQPSNFNNSDLTMYSQVTTTSQAVSFDSYQNNQKNIFTEEKFNVWKKHYEVFEAVLKREDLTPAEKMVYLTLNYHSNNKTGKCNPSFQTLKKEIGCKKEDTVKDHIDNLESKNIISITRRKGGKNHNFSHQYTLLLTESHPEKWDVNNPINGKSHPENRDRTYMIDLIDNNVYINFESLKEKLKYKDLSENHNKEILDLVFEQTFELYNTKYSIKLNKQQISTNTLKTTLDKLNLEIMQRVLQKIELRGLHNISNIKHYINTMVYNEARDYIKPIPATAPAEPQQIAPTTGQSPAPKKAQHHSTTAPSTGQATAPKTWAKNSYAKAPKQEMVKYNGQVVRKDDVPDGHAYTPMNVDVYKQIPTTKYPKGYFDSLYANVRWEKAEERENG